MKQSLISWLECPRCRARLALRDAAGGDLWDGELRCMGCASAYPVIRGIPRFVPARNYADNFGLQWTAFRRTQLDSYNGTTISRDRFVRSTGWSRRDLEGKLLLDVGCGAGRFAEIALNHGARVVAVDYSAAVEAARENLAGREGFDVVQADVYSLPFAAESFDHVYCLGVLQHTPDVAGAFRTLARPLKRGGRLAVDVYPKTARNLLKAKTWLRPVSRRVSPERLLRWVRRLVPPLLPVSTALGQVPCAGRWLRHAVPISNYAGRLPLSRTQLQEWAILDTFDMLSATYDSPQRAATLARWFAQLDFRDVEVFRVEQLVGRGTK